MLVAAAGYAVAAHGALEPVDWYVVLGIVGLAAVLQAACGFPRDSLPRLDRLALWGALLFPVYVAFQLIPLPGFLIRTLDPTRAEIAQAVGNVIPSPDFAPLSVAPLITAVYLSCIAGYALTFFLIRHTSRRFPHLPWAPAIPLIAIGAAEAVLGLTWRTGGTEPISGTYYSKDHFAGLVEMTLPFALVYGLALLLRGRRQGQLRASSVVRGYIFFFIATAMFVAVTLSLSKMGFLSVLGSVLVMGIVGWGARVPGRRKWFAIAGLAVLAALALAFLPTDELVARMGSAASDSTAEGRLPVAKDTLRMIAAYPLFGVGMGAYYPALLRYQTTELSLSVINAHNDYLQLVSELGVLGFLIPATLMCCIFARAVRTASSAKVREVRFLGLACTGGLAALLIHSLADFNLYIPANAMIFSWIAGVSAGLPALPPDAGRNPSGPGPALLRGFVLAAGCLSILYAGAWLLFLHSYRDDPSAERLFCRFGVCDSLRAAYAVASSHGGDIVAAPQADLLEFLRRDPASPFPWEDLGEALQRAGKTSEAGSCFATALTLGPLIPNVLIRAARFHFDLAENAQGFALMARAVEGDPAGAATAFDEYERRRLSLGDVLRYGLPADPAVWRSYLRRQRDGDRAPDTIAVWNAIASRGYADDLLANEVVEFLIRRKRPGAAQQAWALYAGRRSPGYPTSTRVFNGDFESDPTGNPFDWKLGARAGFTVSIDSEIAYSGRRSASIRLDGTENLDTFLIEQEVFLSPGRYKLRAYVKMNGVDTDQGISLRVASDRETVTTGNMTGTNDWRLAEMEFQAPASDGLVRVGLFRRRSLKFDSLIKGTVWIDHVEIVPI